MSSNKEVWPPAQFDLERHARSIPRATFKQGDARLPRLRARAQRVRVGARERGLYAPSTKHAVDFTYRLA